MKVERMSKTSIVIVMLGMSLVLTGIGFAQQSTSNDGSSRFIQRFDKDGDGLVSREEFPGPKDHFTNLDVNKDDYIDASEAPKGPPPQ